MKVNHIYSLVNEGVATAIGQTDLLKEDLTNLIEVGQAIDNAKSYDKFTGTLVDRIGKVIIKDRMYKGQMISVLHDATEYGSITELIEQTKGPEVTESECWELEDGASYDTNVFVKPKNILVLFRNNKTTFTIRLSVAKKQVKSAFTSANEMDRFLNLLFVKVNNKMRIALENLIHRTINNFIGVTIHEEYSAGNDYATKSGIRAVNLLKLYNDTKGTSEKLTKDKCLYSLDFLKFASFTMSNYIDFLKVENVQFNIGGTEKFTDEENLHFIALGMFARASDSYLESDTYHNELVKLPKYEKTTYWQTTKGLTFDKLSAINVKAKKDDTTSFDVSLDGILAVMFDDRALGVSNEEMDVEAHYVEGARFTNYWYTKDAQYFNDFNENFVVFFVA